MPKTKVPGESNGNGSGLDFEAQPWAAADKLRGHIRGIDANLGPRNADSFRQDLHPDLKADFVPVRKDLANPPFNMSDWGRENLPRTRGLLLLRLLSGKMKLETN